MLHENGGAERKGQHKLALVVGSAFGWVVQRERQGREGGEQGRNDELMRSSERERDERR